MPIIRIEMIEGRSVEQKRQLARKITDAIVGIVKTKPENVRIYFYDLPKSNMAHAGTLRVDQEKAT
jgi:4-oxalocrotonate tautomerase